MALRFSCQNCGQDIITKYQKIGEAAKCRACDAENVVPEAAAEVPDPEYFYYRERGVSPGKEPETATPEEESEPTEHQEDDEERYAKIRQNIKEFQEERGAQEKNRSQLESEILAKMGRPYVTFALVGINVFIWLLMTLAGGSTKIPILVKFGAQMNLLVSSGDYWRLFTPMFLHIGVIHLLFNCVALLIFGRVPEILYGKARYIAIYLISGYVGNLLFLALGKPNIVSAGASGAIFGIIGANIPLGQHLEEKGILSDKRQQLAGVGYVIYMLVGGMGEEGINIWAHVGGLIAGLILGYALLPEFSRSKTGDEPEKVPGKWKQNIWIVWSVIIGIALVWLTVGGFIAGNKPSPYGKLRQFNGGQLFYKSSVTEAEVEKLGNFLVKQGFFDGNLKTTQLYKFEDKYIFRMVVKKGVEKDPQYIPAFQLMVPMLSMLVFNAKPVEIHLCDDKLETIKIVESILTSNGQEPD